MCNQVENWLASRKGLDATEAHMAGIICVKKGIQLSLHVSMVCSTQYFTGLVVEVSNKGGKGTGTGMPRSRSGLGSTSGETDSDLL